MNPRSKLPGAISAVLAGALILSSCGPSSSSIKSLSGKRISTAEMEASITEIMEQAGITGLSCAVINDGKIVFRKAFGFRDNKTGVANNEETVFAGASFSKTVFAYLIMRMVGEGTIDLDKPLEDYLDRPLPALPNYADLAADKRYRRITARMVLSHTTGFPNWRWLNPDDKLSILYDPGYRFSYSGEGYALLQMVVERITGKDLEALSRRYIFDPLQMNRTSFVWRERFEDNTARPHNEYQVPLPLRKRREAGAAGSLFTTAGDYARLLTAILNAQGRERTLLGKMVRPQIRITSERMFGPGASRDTNALAALNLSWGLGWGLFDSAYGHAFFHTGHDTGWQNYTVTYPDKNIGLVLLSNSDNFESAAEKLAERIIGDTYSPFTWLGYVPYDPDRKRTPRPLRPVISLAPEVLRKYEGVYVFADDKTFTVQLDNGRLVGSLSGQDGMELSAETESRFFIKGINVVIEFLLDDEGAAVKAVLTAEGVEFQAPKIR